MLYLFFFACFSAIGAIFNRKFLYPFVKTFHGGNLNKPCGNICTTEISQCFRSDQLFVCFSQRGFFFVFFFFSNIVVFLSQDHYSHFGQNKSSCLWLSPPLKNVQYPWPWPVKYKNYKSQSPKPLKCPSPPTFPNVSQVFCPLQMIPPPREMSEHVTKYSNENSGRTQTWKYYNK